MLVWNAQEGEGSVLSRVGRQPAIRCGGPPSPLSGCTWAWGAGRLGLESAFATCSPEAFELLSPSLHRGERTGSHMQGSGSPTCPGKGCQEHGLWEQSP